jgi:hypothetical protein
MISRTIFSEIGLGRKRAFSGRSPFFGVAAPDATTTQICGHLSATARASSKPRGA